MKSEITRFSSRIKLALPIIVLLFLFAAAVVSGQLRSEPTPENIKVAEQPDCPVKVSIKDLPAGQRIGTYSLLNVSTKSIRGFVVTGRPWAFSEPQILGPAMLPGVTRAFGIFPDTKKEGPGEAFLQVDYILFSDGSSWGSDAAGESETILGFIEGQKKVAADARRLVEQNDDAGLNEFISKPPYLANAGPVENRTKRQIAYARGYSSGIYSFKESIKSRGDLKGIPVRISDIERNFGIESAITDDRKKISLYQGIYLAPPPVKILDLTLGKNSVSLDQSFAAGPDWLKGLTFKIKNTSGKTIKYLSFNLNFPETAAAGNIMMYPLSYGWPLSLPNVSKSREDQTGIAPDVTFELSLNEIEYGSLKKFLATRQSLDTLTRLNISNLTMHFDDGTGWSMGELIKQDPDNPHRWGPAKP